MVVHNIFYSPRFIEDFKALPKAVRQRAEKIERLFRLNPLHPSVRLHRLHGKLLHLWSISVDRNIRCIFERMPNGDIVFSAIGHHNIYRSL